MGWCSDTDIDLRFRDPAAWAAFVADVADHYRSLGFERPLLPTLDTPERVVALCGECNADAVEFDGLRLQSLTWGTWHGDPVLALATPYADGHVDFTNNDDGQPFRLRLRDGQIHQHPGRIVYPDDGPDNAPPRAELISEGQAWDLITGIQSGQVDAHDLRCLLADPAGWIADSATATAAQLRAAGPASAGQARVVPIPTILMAQPAGPVTPAAGRTRPGAPATGRGPR